MNLGWIEEEISKPETYIRVLERVAQKGLRGNSLTEELQTMLSDPDHAGQRLSEWAVSESPLLEPHRQIELNTGDKIRTIYTVKWPYRVVLMALQDIIAKQLEPLYSDRLYSFRKGRSALNAHREFHLYLKNFDRIWVAKRDITGFGETIVPLILFQKLEEIFPRSELPCFYRLMDQAIQARFLDLEGNEQVLTMGIPSGSPLTPVLENIYLMELDRKMDQICSENLNYFYARYGDDFVFACPDQTFFQKTISEIDQLIATLGLHYSEKKRIDCELGASTHYLEWLGASFMNKGRMGPRPKHFRENYQNFRRSFHSLLRELSKKVGPYPESKEIIQSAIEQFLSNKNNTRLDKILFHRNDDSSTKTMDYNIRMLLVRWLSRQYKMKKSQAWKELQQLKIPSLNYQRRFRWKW